MHQTSQDRWDEYFFDILEVVARKSKDPSTSVGSLIVGPHNEILSPGYNGFPIGVRDDPEEVPERYERPLKYDFTEHAERNSIYLAARRGISLEGGILYVSIYPCADCARAIIQSGIVEIVVNGPVIRETKPVWGDRWMKSMATGLLMFQEANVNVRVWRDEE